MSFTAGAGTRFVVTSTASQSSGTVLTGPITVTAGTATADTPAFNITQTWNNAAVTFTGLRFNVTDTASNANSLLMDLQVGGVSRFYVQKDATVWATTYRFSSFTAGVYGFQASSNGWIWNSNGVSAVGWVNNLFFLEPQTQIRFGSDLFLARDAANALAQRNSTNAQTFRLYNTFTDASNYERAALQWQSNELQLRVDGAGTGQNRPFQIVVGNQVVAYFNSSGNRSIALGVGAVATNATSGFVYVPTCAGTPTGGPEIYTGRAAIVVDTTNNKLYFYSGGAWRDAGP